MKFMTLKKIRKIREIHKIRKIRKIHKICEVHKIRKNHENHEIPLLQNTQNFTKFTFSFSGNIMNTGSKNAQSVGFDISYLPKLSNTKDRENKNTLLHFLVEYVERDYPELLAFADEVMHLDNASRVNVENLKKVLTQMDSSIKNLEMDLKNAQRSPTEKDDRFVEAMGSFCQQAREQCDILQAMAQKMDTLYSSLAEYFVFDKQKYSLEEFMSDIKKFKDQFKVSFEKYIKIH